MFPQDEKEYEDIRDLLELMKKITTPVGFRRNVFSIKIILFSSSEVSVCDENPVGMTTIQPTVSMTFL